MTAVVIVTDAAHDDRHRAARLGQITGLYRSLGLAVDLVVLGQGGRGTDAPRIDGPLRHFGHLPAPGDNDPGAAEWLGRFLLCMGGAGGYAICHLDCRAAAPARRVARLRVADDVGGSTGRAGDADLWLTPTEPARAIRQGDGRRALRLPVAGRVLRLRAPGTMSGWAGPWNTGRVTGWTGLLAEMARQGADPAGGILLAGEGAAEVEVPDTIAHRLVVRGTDAGAMAIGLALAPGAPEKGDPGAIAELLAAGRPVILPPDVAGQHEGRWRLPLAEGPGDAVRLLREWLDDAGCFADAVAQTREALETDVRAMTRHVSGELRAMLADGGA